jgi:hypothetical protein
VERAMRGYRKVTCICRALVEGVFGPNSGVLTF